MNPPVPELASPNAQYGVPPPPRQRSEVSRLLVRATGLAVLLFLCLPVLVVLPMSFSSSDTLTFPPPGFSLRWYRSFFLDADWRGAALNSFVIGCASSTLAVVLGTLAAYALVRGRFVGRKNIESNFIAPMALPSVVTAVALYIFMARIGILGSYGGLIAAHAVLTAPYVVLLMSLAIQGFDVRIENVALTLGASRMRVLLSILLPNLLPSALASWLFAFVISFDEVVVTLFVSGTYNTIPKKMFNELVLQIDPTITAIASLLIIFSVLVVMLVSRLPGETGVPSQARARR